MSAFTYLTGPTGGLTYHTLALMYRRSLWRPFLERVEHWLEHDWQPDSPHLVVFGSSAGWTMPRNFIRSFDSVTCVEPDPLARWLFRRRFMADGKKKFSAVARSDLLPWASQAPTTFGEFVNSRPNHAFLFSNILGQVALLPDETTRHRKPSPAHAPVADTRTHFISALQGREWASYHDLFSSRATPYLNIDAVDIASIARIANIAPAATSNGGGDVPSDDAVAADLAAKLFPMGADITDHETLWLSRGRPTRLAIWNLRPAQHHVIGFTCEK
jgi:hypothetical protein